MVVSWVRAAPVLAALLGVVFAGCSDGGPPKADPDDALGALDEVEVDTSVDRGAIKGVVVDEAIRPIAHANLTLTPGGKVAQTDAGGVFVFESLEPGTYFVNASATGFSKVQGSADVTAGQVASLKLMVQRIYVPTPRHETVHYQGFMPAYLSFASFAAEVVAPGSTGCVCTWELEPDQNGLTTFVYEVIGTSLTENPAPVYGTIYWELIGEPGTQIESAHANFPVYEVMARDVFENETESWTVRVTGSQWFHVNTSYDVYVTMWYHSVPPEGWSFVAGDP